MKLKDVRAIPWRIKSLITRRFVWVDQEDGEEHTTNEDLATAWAMVGVHSYKWWWVNRWGNLSCGCLRNPLTRRVIAYSFDCHQHWPLRIEES